MAYVTQLININTEYHPMPNLGLTSPELDTSFERYPHPIPVYCKQDGADFYMHHDPETDEFIDAISSGPYILNSDIAGAIKARVWFREICSQHGLRAIFV